MTTYKISALFALWLCLIGQGGLAQDMILGDAGNVWVNNEASRVFGADVSQSGLSDLSRVETGFGLLPVADIINAAPALGFLSAPYAILDHKHLAKINKDSSLLKAMSAPLVTFDLDIIGIAYLGQKMLMTKSGEGVEAPLKPAAIRQKTIAVTRDHSNMYGVRDLGGVPVPLMADQMHTALEFGAVAYAEHWAMDAWPSRCVSIAMTGHQIELGLIVAKHAWWHQLSSEDQAMLRTKFVSHIEDLTQAVLDQETALLADHRANGCDLVAVDVASFKDHARQTIATSAKPTRWLTNVYQSVMALGG